LRLSLLSGLLSLAILMVYSTTYAQDEAAIPKPRTLQPPPTGLPLCSTEKTNPNCFVIVNRYYPATLPTIRMERHTHLFVFVSNPVQYETLWLDRGSVQVADTEDQVQSAVTNVIPQAKAGQFTSGLFNFESAYITANVLGDKTRELQSKVGPLDQPKPSPLQQEVLDLRTFTNNAVQVLAQVNEASSQLSPATFYGRQRPNIRGDFPSPWIRYEYWSYLVQYELTGAKPPDAFRLLPGLPSGLIPLGQRIDDRNKNDLSSAEQETVATALAQADTILKTLQAISAQISLVQFPDTMPCPDDAGKLCVYTGFISDPNPSGAKLPHYGSANQATFTVNEVNMINGAGLSTSMDSLKKAVTTIVAQYGNPSRFEISTGTMFSTLPNRSFSAETKITQTPGGPTEGEVMIVKTLSRPAIVPFAAANLRMTPEWTWLGNRRGAAYLTGALGLNPYHTTTDYAVGPSVSWRLVMLSGLFHWGHDSRLTQGYYANQTICTNGKPSQTIPACGSSPPPITTETYIGHAFALGIALRIVPTFAGK